MALQLIYVTLAKLLAWMILGGVLWVTLIGIPVAMLIWGVAWLWMAYRIIRGFLDLNNNKAMPV